MSTGADCHFTEREPGKWFYELQCWPYGEWSEYESYGPFPTLDKAIYHLDQNHANPGGWSEAKHPDHQHGVETREERFPVRTPEGPRWVKAAMYLCCHEKIEETL